MKLKSKSKAFLVGILTATNETNSIGIRNPVIFIRGSGSVSKCHESGTLPEVTRRSKDNEKGTSDFLWYGSTWRKVKNPGVTGETVGQTFQSNMK